MGAVNHDTMVLQNWFSPAFPTGAFSYSHGLEMAIQDGYVTDGESLCDWITTLLLHGTARNDALFIRGAYDGVGDVNMLCFALSASKERHQETIELGHAFTRVLNSSHGAGLPAGLAYPVAVGMAAQQTGLDVTLTIQSYLQAFATNLISVGVRIIPIGQQSGQDCLLRLYPVIQETTMAAMNGTLDNLGSSAFMSDLMAMKHENTSPRIYRT